MNRCRCRRFACWTGLILLTPALALGQPTIDGRSIKADFAAAPTVSSQRIQTQFGDHANAASPFGSGSELDKLFIENDGQNLYIGLTGNLENNGNCIAIFLDVSSVATGTNKLATRTLGSPGAIDFLPRYLSGNPNSAGPFGLGLHGLQFDAGFSPDYALGVSGGSPRGSQTRTYWAVNWTTLAPDSNDPNNLSNIVAGVMTDGFPTASGSSGTLGDFLATGTTGILGAADNTNAGGVAGGTHSIDDPNLPLADDPNDPNEGFEFAIPLSLLGASVDDTVCVYVLVSSPDGFTSNQMLPPPATTNDFPNPGPVPGGAGFTGLDLSVVSGNQFICHTVTSAGGCGAGCQIGGACADVNGDGAVNLTDLAVILANFGLTGGATQADGDTNGDGNVNLTDLANVLAIFGAAC